MKSVQRNFLLVLLLIFISRIPFIFSGYGVEEDAWAMRLVVERMATTGNYEVSRLPGHPVQELLYSLIWNRGAVAFNLLTLLLSTAGFAFFMMSLYKLQIKNYLWAGVALAFVPVIYNNSANALDYTWALSFLMMGFYFVVCNNVIVAGLFIAFAIGCRITSGAMLLPYFYLAWHLFPSSRSVGTLVKLISSTILLSALIFIPVYIAYGFDFFEYYQHFPLPSFAKSFYKASFAVWGTIGFGAVLISSVCVIIKQRNIHLNALHRNVLITAIIAILLYLIAFIKLPLKAAFMVPLVPFVIVVFAVLLSQKQFKVFGLCMIAACFLFGINLSDPYRAEKPSILSYQKTIANQQISFDVLQGPVIADYLKRKHQIRFAESVIDRTNSIKNKTVVIAGWWLATILVLQPTVPNQMVMYRYYLTETELQFYQKNGYVIYYLHQQDELNDLRYDGIFTKKYASLLTI